MIPLHMLGEILVSHAPQGCFAQATMIIWPCGFPNDYGAFCFEIAAQFVKNGPTFFPDMVKGTIHGNQICRFWQRKRVDVALRKVQTVTQTLLLGCFLGLSHIFRKTIQT